MTTMEAKTKIGRSVTRSWLSKPGTLPSEKSRSKTIQLFFRGLNLGHYSKSILILSGFQTASRHSGSTSPSESMIPVISEDSLHAAKFCSSPSLPSASKIFSTSGWTLSSSSSERSPTAYPAKRSSSRGHRGMKSRKPVLLEKVPFGKSGKYLTVYIGKRTDQCVKYVIRKSILKHPLFQLLLKCSEDEFGEDYTVKKGVAIICDPELFIEVVRAVDDSLWSLGNNEVQVLD